MLTVGKADLDMAAYGAADKGTPQAKMIPIVFKVCGCSALVKQVA